MSDWDAGTELRYERHREAFLCSVEDLHPYECGGPGACIHCDRRVVGDHRPDQCELCEEGERDG